MKTAPAFVVFVSVLVGVVHGDSFPKCEPFLAKCLDSVLKDGDCGPLPVRKSSYPPQIRPEEGYNVRKLRYGVYTVTEGLYFAMIIATSRRVLVVDSPESAFLKFDPVTGAVVGTRIFDAVVEITKGRELKRIDLIFTHSHFDHIGSATLLLDALRTAYPDARFKVWGSKGTASRIAKSSSGRAPVPDHVFSKKVSLRVSRRLVLDLIAIDGGHSEGDTLVYVRPYHARLGIAMLVDVIYPGWVPAPSFALTKDMGEYLATHDLLLKLDFSILIGGHLTRLGTKRDVRINKKYTEDVLAAAKTALVEVNVRSDLAPFPPINDPTSPFFGNVLMAFTTFNRNIETLCAVEVLKKWGCRLAGADAVVRTHCATASFYLRFDV